VERGVSVVAVVAHPSAVESRVKRTARRTFVIPTGMGVT
jgi:hypothetical protein